MFEGNGKSMIEHQVVISADCPVGLPTEEYVGYLDPRFRVDFEDSFRTMVSSFRGSLRGSPSNYTKGGGGCSMSAADLWEHPKRARLLDHQGCSAEIISPDTSIELNSPPFGAGLTLRSRTLAAELRWAGARAHNRWAAEFCAQSPDRHVGLAVLPVPEDREPAIAEILWASDKGLRGVVLPARGEGGRAHSREIYDPIWEICEDLGLVVSFQLGDHLRRWGEACDSETMLFLPTTRMIWDGVFERFPNLKVMLAKSSADWVPRYLSLLDSNHETSYPLASPMRPGTSLSMKPSECFRRNVSISVSDLTHREVRMRHEIGLKNILWSSDCPLADGSWKQGRIQFIDLMKGVPVDEASDLLGRNCARIFGLNLAKLRPIANRIGPAKDESFEPSLISENLREEFEGCRRSVG